MNKKMKTLNFGGEDTYILTPEWDNVENKPFGDFSISIYSGEMEMMANEEITMPNALIDFPEENIEIMSKVHKISVMWGGTLYECERKPSDFMDIFGNSLALGLEDTGEPFCILCWDNCWQIADMTATEPYTHNVEITGEAVIKVPDKYMTEPIIYSENDGWNKDFTFEELKALVDAGFAVQYDTGSIRLNALNIVKEDEYYRFVFGIFESSGTQLIRINYSIHNQWNVETLENTST